MLKNLQVRWKPILLLLTLLLGVAYWYYRDSQTSVADLSFIKPERGSLTKTLEVTGVVSAKEYATLRFAGGGKLVYLGAKEGDFVQKGKTIATIDQRSLRKSLEKSLNEYSKERISWDQQLDDVKDRWLPVEEDRVVDTNQLNLNQTVLDVEINNIAITNTVLSAPFDGVLVSLPSQTPGVNLSVTDGFEFVNPNTLLFRAQVDELDIAQLTPGQKAIIQLDAYPEDSIETTVNFISLKSAQTSSSTVFLVDLPISEPDLSRFRLGMNGDATIIVEEKYNTLFVPIEVTTERDGKWFLNVRTGEQSYQERQITVGLETDDHIEILSGVTESDEVLQPN